MSENAAYEASAEDLVDFATLERMLLDLEVAGDYTKACAVKQKLSRLRERLFKDQIRDLKKRHSKEQQELNDKFFKEKEELDSIWKRKLEQQEQKMSDSMYEILLEQEVKLQHLQDDLRVNIPPFRPSGRLQRMYELEQSLAQRGQYTKAREARQDANVQLRLEQMRFTKSWKSKAKVRQRSLQRKHKTSLAAAKKRARTQMDIMRKNQILDLKRFEQRFRNAKMDLDSKQRFEKESLSRHSPTSSSLGPSPGPSPSGARGRTRNALRTPTLMCNELEPKTCRLETRSLPVISMQRRGVSVVPTPKTVRPHARSLQPSLYARAPKLKGLSHLVMPCSHVQPLPSVVPKALPSIHVPPTPSAVDPSPSEFTVPNTEPSLTARTSFVGLYLQRPDELPGRHNRSPSRLLNSPPLTIAPSSYSDSPRALPQQHSAFNSLLENELSSQGSWVNLLEPPQPSRVIRTVGASEFNDDTEVCTVDKDFKDRSACSSQAPCERYTGPPTRMHIIHEHQKSGAGLKSDVPTSACEYRNWLHIAGSDNMRSGMHPESSFSF
eukprot:gnl/Chilomastix_cuspidata/1638.p2 GENE.gnl/Chilomastix_cuspidata/1638~~gnl/Chilomastix_cuspidata/1638.p2  ORF type:complete len:551 (-),score=44.83 gnl/Chilomastix_cuspidata/1638:2512-4164(-)